MMSADAIIMSQITRYATSDKGGVSDFMTSIIPRLPVIIFMVVIKKCIENSGDFFHGAWITFKALLSRLFYTETRIFNFNDAANKQYHFKKSIEKRYYSFANQYFPISVNTEPYQDDSKTLVVSYMNWLPSHQKLIEECEKEAEVECNTFNLAKSQTKIIYMKLGVQDGNLKYVPSVASKLYPSRNYTNLVSIIKDHVAVAKIVKSYSVLGMLIDGVPGLGKTKFADFAVDNKVVGCVYKVDMTNMLKYSFSRVLNAMYHNISINTDTIFMIDEIDKYIDYRVDIEYADALKVQSNNKVKKGDSESDETTTILSKEEFVRQTKTTFLYDMLSILERDGLEHSVVVIFCSNNFRSVFEGVDMTHHKSLYNRFMKIQFEECDHTEIINYMLHYNTMFNGTPFQKELEKSHLEKLLRQDIHVTHRTLHHISIESKYNAYTMIEKLNKYVHEDDSGESIGERVSKIKSNVQIKSLVTEDIEKNESEPGKDESKDETEDESKDEVKPDDHGPLDHELLWREKYQTKKYPQNKNEIIENIKKFLNDVSDVKGSSKKAIVAAELFDYLSDEGYLVMVDLRLKTVIVEKIKEFSSEHPEVFFSIKPSTKEFIYAVSGIRY